MYSTKKIPAPFQQPCQKNSQKEKMAGKLPASPAEPPKEAILPIITTEEKTTQKKTAPQGVSPFLALAFLELLSLEK